MTDLVEALKDAAKRMAAKNGDKPEDYLVWFAAGEIERLRSSLDLMHERASSAEIECRKLEARLEQLREDD